MISPTFLNCWSELGTINERKLGIKHLLFEDNVNNPLSGSNNSEINNPSHSLFVVLRIFSPRRLTLTEHEGFEISYLFIYNARDVSSNT